MTAPRAWRAALVAAVVVLAACGDGGDASGGSGNGDRNGLPKLPLGAVGPGRSSATMSAEAAADSSASMLAPVRVVEYRVAEDARAVPETATAYEVKPRSRGDVREEVAKALDVSPERVEVGAAGHDWYYSSVSPETAVSSSPSCAPDEKCIEASPPTTVPGVPSAEDGEARARDILEALGVPLEDGRFEVLGEDGYNRTVQFTPSVEGIPVAGLQTQIAFGAEGRVEYANGVLAEVESVGDYPLVGLDEAVTRLREGFGAGGVRTLDVPEPAVDPAASGSSSGGGSGGSTGSAGSGVAEDAAPPEPAPPEPACVEGEPCTVPPSPPSDEPTMTIEPQPAEPPVPLEPQVIEITGADLSLQLVAAGCPDDPVYLVPTFDLLPGPATSVIAVEDDAVAGADGAAEDVQPCPGQPQTDVPAGKPEPANP